jgi:predicted metal-dependent RNase
MVVIWFGSLTDDATAGSVFVSYQFQDAKGKQYQSVEESVG